MIIGVPKEIKILEGRVGLTPSGVSELKKSGHTVLVETDAGTKSGFTDEEYARVGAEIISSSADIYSKADMIVKVKEPLEPEYDMLREGQILFTYLHLAPDAEQTQALLDRRVIGIAYETVQLPNGALPLLSPMSEVAGRMSVQVAASLLEAPNNGRGILLAGVTGVERGRVVILGGGNVGTAATKIAVGMGADVTVLDISSARLQYLDEIFNGRIQTLASNEYNIAKAVEQADALIGCVLIPGAKTPMLVSEDMVKSMRTGSVIVDVAIDQGGTIATIDQLTTHENPYFIKHGVIHYSVPNMPGAVPRTSTFALTNATISYALAIANKGAEAAIKDDSALMKGLNVYKGVLTFKAVADAQGREYTPAETLLG